MWAGSSVHATPQVVAAGFAYGTEAAEIALVVKLVRILLLAPCVVLIGLWYGPHAPPRAPDLRHQAVSAS